MKKYVLLISLFFSVNSFSQNLTPGKICSTNEVCLVENLHSKLKSIESRNYKIPVVFHVFDAYDPKSKLSAEGAQKAIDLLNANFSGHSRHVEDIQSQFLGIIAEVGIEFVLARKDPYGNPINGVTYHTKDFKGDNPGANSTMKSMVNWNTGADIGGVQRYLQIWATYNVNDDDWGSGWCYLPNYDKGGKWAGPVFNHKFLGDGSSENDDILTHEIGHYFGLSHVFGSSYDSCGDDGIDDTPITRCFVWECRKGDLCNDGIVNVENYMSYSGCTSMFTLGQKELMLYWLNDPSRSNLWSEENLKFTGVDDISTGIDQICETKITIYPNPSDGDFNVAGTEKFSLQMYDLSGRQVYQTNKKHFSYKKPGIYLIVIQSNSRQEKIKVVVN